MADSLDTNLDLIVLNCTLATAEEVKQCDIGVKGEKVHSILPCGSLRGVQASKVIDAQGALVTVSSYSPLTDLT